MLNVAQHLNLCSIELTRMNLGRESESKQLNLSWERRPPEFKRVMHLDEMGRKVLVDC